MDHIYLGTMQYNLIYIYSMPYEDHVGLLKIGMTSFQSESSYLQLTPNCDELNKFAHKRIKEQTRTGLTQYTLHHTELARKQVRLADGTIESTSFTDHDVHIVLDNSGYSVRKFHDTNQDSEWYQISPAPAITAIRAVKEGRDVLTPAEKGEAVQTSLFATAEPQAKAKPKITLREEQQECIDKTKKVFKSGDRMLWDCKMRFGKTITAYSLVKQMGFQKVLVVTHRPAVVDGWRSDFDLIFPDGDRVFRTKSNIKAGDRFTSEDAGIDRENDRMLRNLVDSGKPFVYFASMQDLRGSKLVGGPHDKNHGVFELDWDLIIYDEAHEGTQTELGLEVQQLLEQRSDGGTPKKVLQLSGTPYNLLNQYDTETTYSWDYVKEQRKKQEWDEKHPGDHNPYAELPELRICTFDLREKLATSYRYEDESVAFNFREFFRTWTGDPKRDFHALPAGAKVGDFVHEADVNAFLDLISTDSEDSNYPFATPEYREMFKHTFWILPGVKEARAFSALLQKHDVFGNGKYLIANVAGEGDEEQPYDDALKLVRAAIDNPEHKPTITLSCGKLTTGVTVKQWTGVMLLSGSSSTGAAGYMQTVFRVQSAGSVDGKQKKICYAFDFAPDRALTVLSEVHKLKKSAVGTDDNGRIALGEFLNFCPVLAEGDTGMVPYDVPKMMRQIKRITVDAAVKSGFDDESIYKADAGIVMDYEKAKLFETLKAKLSPQKKADKQKKVQMAKNGLTDEEYQKAQDAKRKPKKERTKEELEALEKERQQKKQQQALFALLRNVSIRLPLLIYGTARDFDESIRLEQFIDIVDDESWKIFMPEDVDKSLFRKMLVFYDQDVIEGAGLRIRRMAKAADEMMPTQRILRIAEIFSCFRNPAKETVLTPWRVVNMHLGDTIGGYNFYKEGYPQNDGLLEEPRVIDHGKVTEDVFLNDRVRVLEMNSKSGLYPLYVAYSIYRILISKPEAELTLAEANAVWDKVVTDHLFVLCQTKMAVQITKRTLVGYRNVPVSAKSLPHLLDQMKDPARLARKLTNPETWNKEGDRLKFDAIVGNPPYQSLTTGGTATGTAARQATPVFNAFVSQAKALNPKYISMIIPARWYNGGIGLNDFRTDMLNDRRMALLVDYANSKELFPTVDIAGGICYFLWDQGHTSDCNVVNVLSGERVEQQRALNAHGELLIRSNKALGIIEKVTKKASAFVSDMVSAIDTFGIPSKEKGHPNYEDGDIVLIHSVGANSQGMSYISPSVVKKNHDLINKYKIKISILVPQNGEVGIRPENGYRSISTPQIIYPGQVDSFSYLNIGFFDTELEAINFRDFMTCKFPRFMMRITYSSAHISKANFIFVPMMDFREAWTDAKLYEYFDFDADEVALIENTMRPLILDDSAVEENEEAFATDFESGSNSVLVVTDDLIIRYYAKEVRLEYNTVGSWRIPFDGRENAARICKAAIKAGAVAACAHDDLESGLIYFYVDGTSDDAHRALLTWLRDNGLLPREPDGSYTDIIYAYDVRSADNPTPDAKLSDYINL